MFNSMSFASVWLNLTKFDEVREPSKCHVSFFSSSVDKAISMNWIRGEIIEASVFTFLPGVFCHMPICLKGSRTGWNSFDAVIKGIIMSVSCYHIGKENEALTLGGHCMTNYKPVVLQILSTPLC